MYNRTTAMQARAQNIDPQGRVSSLATRRSWPTHPPTWDLIISSPYESCHRTEGGRQMQASVLCSQGWGGGGIKATDTSLAKHPHQEEPMIFHVRT